MEESYYEEKAKAKYKPIGEYVEDYERISEPIFMKILQYYSICLGFWYLV